jgi:hypothetical protein
VKNITLVAIDGLGTESDKYESIVYGILDRFQFLNINEILFITPNKQYKNSKFNIIYLPKPLNYIDLNELMFQGLIHYTSGEYFMVIQTDGYPLNPDNWNQEYLEYDYIGAPWPSGMRWTGNNPLVGNGGFSIRSRKLYEITKSVQGYREFHNATRTNEDVTISAIIRSHLESSGIKFAPVELAAKFSVEIPLSEDHTIDTTFGFHGKSHLERMILQNDSRLL